VNWEKVTTVTSIIAAALGIAAIVFRPFLLVPIAMLFLYFSARQSPNQRLTLPVAVIVALGALAGAAVAAGFSKPLY
jgi:uncharacterized membrane protein YcaP (DUF421 family)